MSDPMIPLAEMAGNVLKCADGRGKTNLSRGYASQWQAARADGEIPEIGRAEPTVQPGRPDKPELLIIRAISQIASQGPLRAGSPCCTPLHISN